MGSSLFVKNLIAAMQVRCVTILETKHMAGKICDWTGRMDDCIRHAGECMYAMLSCDNIGCHEVVQRRLKAAHESQCEYKICACEYCGVDLKKLEIVPHQQSSCPNFCISCVNGCGVELPRKDLTTHTAQDCPLQVVTCSNVPCQMKLPRNAVADHDSKCSYKVVTTCGACSADLTRNTIAIHEAYVCPRFCVDCPNECGSKLCREGLLAHISSVCPLEIVQCPYISMGCSSTCPKWLPRKDLDSHLDEPATVRAVMQSTVPVVSSLKDRLLSLETIIENEVINQYFPSTIIARWDSVSLETLFKLLRFRGSGRWNDYHIAFEFDCEEFIGNNREFELESPVKDLGGGVTARLTLRRQKDDGNVGCYIKVSGFRGKIGLSITAFPLDKGVPSSWKSSYTLGSDSGFGWCPFLTQDELTAGTYTTKSSTLALFATVSFESINLLPQMSHARFNAVATRHFPTIPLPSWKPDSKAALVREDRHVLEAHREQNKLEGFISYQVPWVCSHAGLADKTIKFEQSTQVQELGDGMKCCIKLLRQEADSEEVYCNLILEGFRGVFKYSMTLFSFGTHGPVENENEDTLRDFWKNDEAHLYDDRSRFTFDPTHFLTDDKRMICGLLTLHLERPNLLPILGSKCDFEDLTNKAVDCYKLLKCEIAERKESNDGEVWTTHFINEQFRGTELGDGSTLMVVGEDTDLLGSTGVQGHIAVERKTEGGRLYCYVALTGFEGTAEIILTVMNFEPDCDMSIQATYTQSRAQKQRSRGLVLTLDELTDNYLRDMESLFVLARIHLLEE